MKHHSEIVLTGAQKRARDELLNAISPGEVLLLQGAAGSGRTTVLQQVHAVAGGVLVEMREFLQSLAARNHAAVEEAFLGMLEQALSAHSLVIVDDLHLLSGAAARCDYPLGYLLDAALTAILAEAAASRKTLVFGLDGDAPWPVRRRARPFAIAAFAAGDYECVCRQLLPPDVANCLDFAHIHRSAPALTAAALRHACGRLARTAEAGGAADTAGFLDHLRSRGMPGNAEAGEVRKVDAQTAAFHDAALTAALDLNPKRGSRAAGLRRMASAAS